MEKVTSDVILSQGHEERKVADGSVSRRFRSVLIGLTVMMIAGLFAFGAPKDASAAGPSITACFVYTNGAAYARQPVSLYAKQSGVWRKKRSGTTNSRGCATFTNVTNGKTRYYVYAYMEVKSGYWTEWIGNVPVTHYDVYYYEGWTADNYVGTASVHLGTWYANGPTYAYSI